MAIEQLPLLNEDEGARKATEAKKAFARMHEVVRDTLTWEERVKMGLEAKPDKPENPNRKYFARRLTKLSNTLQNNNQPVRAQKESWTKEHEANQDDRPVQYGPDADHSDLATK